MGVKNFIGKKVSSFSNYSKDVVGYDYLKEQNKELKNTAQKLFGTKEQLKNAKTESFSSAKKRLGLSDVDLVVKYSDMSKLFYTNLGIIGVLFLIILYMLYQGLFFQSLITLTLVGVCCANCFKYSFRCFQIKNKKLCPVSDWAKKGDYFPVLTISGVFTLEDESLGEEEEEEIIELSGEEKKKIEEAINLEIKEMKKSFDEKLKEEEEEYKKKQLAEKEAAVFFMQGILSSASANKKIEKTSQNDNINISVNASNDNEGNV